MPLNEQPDEDYFDEDEDLYEGEEPEYLEAPPPNPDDIWPSRIEDLRRERKKYSNPERLSYSIYEHFDRSPRRFEFGKPELLRTRWAHIPMRLSLPVGTGEGFEGINCGQIYVLDSMGRGLFMKDIMCHIEREEEGGLDFSQPVAISGKIEMAGETIKITHGKRRREQFFESDASKRFFVNANNEDDENVPWRGANLSPSFYKYLVYPYVKGLKTATPFEWAFKRAETAMAFVVAMGYHGDIPPEAVNQPFTKIARDAVNLHPAELNKAKEFPNTEQAQKYMAVLKCNWKEPVPEAVIFALENSGQIPPEFFQDETVRALISKMETWLNNGLVVDRLSELFQALVAKKMDARTALKYSLQLIDEIYGKQNPPWYFHENFSFKPIVTRANLRMESPEEVAEILLSIAKYAGHDFQYVAEAYYKDGVKYKLEKLMPRARAIEFAATVCRWFGIGHIERAVNIINLFADNVGKRGAGNCEETAKLFLEHIERQKPSSEIQGRLEGEEVNAKFPGFSTLLVTFEVHKQLKGRDQVFDAVTIGPAHFRLAEKALASPLAQRALLPPGIKREFRELLAGNHLLLPAAHGEDQKCFPLPPENQAALAKYEQPEKSFLQRLLEFYKQLNEEAVFNSEETATTYFAMFAAKMPDPLKPIPGLLELISRIVVMHEKEITNNLLFANPFSDEYERRREKIIPRQYIRSLAVMTIMESWLKGNITEERIREFLDFLNGKDLVVEHEMSLEDYIANTVEDTISGFDDENEYRKKYGEELMSEAEKTERIEKSKARAAEDYENEKFTAKSRRIEQRVDRVVYFTHMMRELGALAVECDIDSALFERALSGYILNLITGDDSAVKVSRQEVFIGDEDDVLILKLVNLLDPSYVSGEGGLTGVIDVLGELEESSSFNTDEFRQKLSQCQSEEAKMQVTCELFYELKTIVNLRMILGQLQDEFKCELGAGKRRRGYIRDMYSEEMDECTSDKFIERLNRKLGAVEKVLDNKFGAETGGGVVEFKYLPAETLRKAISDIRHLREATAVISAIREIQERIRETVDERPLLMSAGEKTEEQISSSQKLVSSVRQATKTALGIMGSVAAVMHSETARELVARHKLPEGVRPLLPQAHALVVYQGGQQSSGEELTPARLKDRILKKFEVSLPDFRDWIKEVRTEDIGMLPVGGKIQVLHPIDKDAFERVKSLLGLTSTGFQLIHAGKSVIIPASITSKEFTLLVFCLQKLGFITDEFPELQVGGPGRLPNREAGMLGSSVLLATEIGKEYPPDQFVTNQDHLTGARIMAYDAGRENDRLPYMKMPNGKILEGRTDMLGRRNLNDVDLYRLVHTVLAHAEFGMAFSDIGQWYKGEYEKLLKQYGLGWILDAPWVFNSEQEKASPSKGSQEEHYKALCACTSAYFDCADGKNDIVYRVRDLIGELSSKIKQRQEEIARNPERYAEICEESRIAVNF